MSENMHTNMFIKALDMAYKSRKPGSGVIFHSERGAQYASYDFRERLNKYKMIQSMSRKGDCWDNAVAESFFHTLKIEEINDSCIKTKEEAKRKIFRYIEVVYNRKRIHSRLEYKSPQEYEELYYSWKKKKIA